MLLAFSIFFEEANRYNDPNTIWPIKSITSDTISCFLTRSNQYRKNNTFKRIKKGTLKLSTDSTEKVLGGKKGKA